MSDINDGHTISLDLYVVSSKTGPQGSLCYKWALYDTLTEPLLQQCGSLKIVWETHNVQ